MDATLFCCGEIGQALFNFRRQFLGYMIVSNQPEDLLVHPGERHDAFDAPLVGLNDILAFSPSGPSSHRRRVQGVVTHQTPGEYFYIEAEGGALRVNTEQDTLLTVGDRVEAAGFFVLKQRKAEMTGAVFRRLGTGILPSPIMVDVRELINYRLRSIRDPGRDLDDHLITVEGQLVSVGGEGKTLPALVLESAGELIAVAMVGDEEVERLGSLRLSSRLRVTGICSLNALTEPINRDNPAVLSLLLRSVDDLVVVQVATWWTARRLWTALALAVGTLVVSMTWSIVLRRRVAIKGAQLAEESGTDWRRICTTRRSSRSPASTSNWRRARGCNMWTRRGAPFI